MQNKKKKQEKPNLACVRAVLVSCLHLLVE